MSDETMTHEYYELIKREHHELGVAIHDAKVAFEAGPRDVAAIHCAMLRLRDLLESHFTHEEDGGYLREATERAPRVVRRVNALLEQHADLRIAIASLCEEVVGAESENEAWGDLQQKFITFVRELGRHESEENSIVQEAYIEDIGTKD